MHCPGLVAEPPVLEMGRCRFGNKFGGRRQHVDFVRTERGGRILSVRGHDLDREQVSSPVVARVQRGLGRAGDGGSISEPLVRDGDFIPVRVGHVRDHSQRLSARSRRWLDAEATHTGRAVADLDGRGLPHRTGPPAGHWGDLDTDCLAPLELPGRQARPGAIDNGKPIDDPLVLSGDCFPHRIHRSHVNGQRAGRAGQAGNDVPPENCRDTGDIRGGLF